MRKSAEYKCVECGVMFTATQPAKYCSAACKAKHINRQRATFQCVYCGKLFEGTKNQKPKFCSHACTKACMKEVLANPNSPLSAYINIDKNKHNYVRICTICGKHFTTEKPDNVNRHCPDCQKQYMKMYQDNWRAGLVGAKYRTTEADLDAALEEAGIDFKEPENRGYPDMVQNPHKINQTREETNARRRRVYAKKRALGLTKKSSGPKDAHRAHLLETRGNVCEVCGYDIDADALQIHHKDMDRQHNEDSNFIVLCANCHTILHQRIKRNWYIYDENDRVSGILAELDKLIAEVKSRNEAGKPDRATRTEGCEESQSGATHTDTSSTDMSRHEAVTKGCQLSFF